MADEFTFPVLVDCQWNPALPNLKNKLTIYFQSKKSDGGDCWVEHDVSDGQRAIVWFKTEQVRQNVLAKCPHKLKLGQNVLNMSVRLPPETTDAETSSVLDSPEVADEDEVHPATDEHVEQSEEEEIMMMKKKKPQEDPEEPSAVAAVLGNTERLKQEFLEMLVENILKGHQTSTWSLEMLPEISSTVVVFDNAEDVQQFMIKCPSNKMFIAKKLTVRPLEVPLKVRAENIIDSITADHLQLYFQLNETVEEDVEMLEEEQAAIVTFTDPAAVARVTKKQHVISEHSFKVFPYYDSLGMALYGKDKPTWKLPDAFTEDIDSALLKCQQENPECRALIQKHMAKLFSEVDFQHQPVRISPLPSLLQQKKQTPKLIRSWRDSAASGFKEVLLRFKCLQLLVPAIAWKESEVAIRDAIQQKAVSLVLDQMKECMTVAGLSETVDGLGDLKAIVQKVTKKIERESGSQAMEVSVESSIYHLLEGDLKQKIMKDFPELLLKYNKSTQEIELYGLQQEILASKACILEEVFTFRQNGQPVNLDDGIIHFLSEGDQEDINEQLFVSHGINAALEIQGKRVTLMAKTGEAVRDGERQLERLLKHRCVEVEDLNIFRMTEWQQLVDLLLMSVNNPTRKVSVYNDGGLVLVSGFDEAVDSVQKQLHDFVHDNSSISRTVTGKKIVIKFVREQKGDVWKKMTKDDVKIAFIEDSVSLSGPRVRVMECSQTIQDLISSVHHDVLRVVKPGAKKSFMDKETIYSSMAITKWGCLIQLEDDMDSPQANVSGTESKPVFHLQTPDGVDITVFKADMCSFRVDAVVNAANENLQHAGGLAAALLQAAGPQLQDTCDQIISTKGQLSTGDVVVTEAGGRLRCEHIIHAVGPRFSGDPQRAIGLLKRAVKGCLREAESCKCHSLAIPAISSGVYGFPLDLCAETIVKAIKDHCEDMYGDGMLKKIHLVNHDDRTVQAMETAVRKIFNQPAQHQPKARSQPQSARMQEPNQGRGSIPTSSTTLSVQTKEGLIITLLKGNIQDTRTDVVVNTVGPGLRLDQGAVSNALFSAAGPELQNLVDQQSAPPATEGAVIITEGCNLRSKMVYHTVAPQWDGGQGDTERVLDRIVADCLAQAEQDQQKSLTFPAIGTGNLGCPKDMVAKLMLDAVLKFSQKRGSNNVQEVVFLLHPSDTPTTQAFTDEFSQKFLGQPPSSQKKGPFSKITSPSPGLYETRVGGVVLQITSGDITTENTDVIVNSSNDTFTLNSGVSKAILSAAGPAVILECQQQGSQPGQAMIMTQPGNLQCKKILHLHGQTKPQLIQKFVGDAISMCIQNNMKSVSFPALGTGQGNLAPGVVADAMLDAVVGVVGQTSVSSLQLVRFVIFQAPMLADFHKSMQKKEGTGEPAQEGRATKIMSSIKSFFTGSFLKDPKDPKQQKKEDFVFEGKVLVPVFFHICGESQASVEGVKKLIDDLITKELFTDTITDGMLLNLSRTDLERIQELQKKYDVKMSLKEQSNNTADTEDASLTIEGISRDVAGAAREVQNILRKSRETQSLERQMELTSNLVEWQYKLQTQYQAFDSEDNFNLEQANLKNQREVEVTIQGRKYKANLQNGLVVDSRGSQFKIKRIDKLGGDTNVPDYWDDMVANSQCQVFPLKNNSQEYIDVQTQFSQTCRNGILKIERVQNPYLWRNYQIKKQAMDNKNGHQNNERQLFHGTSQPTINHINHNGFNRSYAGKNAAAIGNGTYFAVSASYSASNTYSVPDVQGQKYMYLCRVLTGDFTAGQRGMFVPPAKNNTTADLYDSVTDNPNRPSMFVVFHDIQAYPEYLITFQ